MRRLSISRNIKGRTVISKAMDNFIANVLIVICECYITLHLRRYITNYNRCNKRLALHGTNNVCDDSILINNLTCIICSICSNTMECNFKTNRHKRNKNTQKMTDIFTSISNFTHYIRRNEFYHCSLEIILIRDL